MLNNRNLALPLSIFAKSLFILLGLSWTAKAEYPSAKSNSFLLEEVQTDTQRLIPQSPSFSFAGDTDVYYRNLGSSDAYSAVGYWFQFRSEARASEAMRVNLRSILFAGSCNDGYTKSSGSYHLLGATLLYPYDLWSGRLRLRLSDLERQTIGVGLLVQEKEMNGVWLSWQNEALGVAVRADGTGVLRQGDDTINFEVDLAKGTVGVGTIQWPQGVNEDGLNSPRAPYNYLFSKRSSEFWGYGFEAGERQAKTAALVSLNTAVKQERFQARGKVEARRYNAGFGKDFVGRIQNQYVSYDQYDKAFTNASNVFVTSDDATVLAAHMDLFFQVNSFWRFSSLNETGQFDFKSNERFEYYYFRHAVEHCPVPSRDDCLNIFVSNKVLTDGGATPPSLSSSSNSALFKTRLFAGIELRMRF